MAKIENRSMIKGHLSMSKKWNNKGVPRAKVGGTKTTINDKREKFKI